jgi:hypothetical protein
MTVEQYEQILVGQGGACAICGGKDPCFGRDWHVDHDHATGAVRGVLCAQCNIGLGHFKDNVTALGSAIKYLEHHNARLLQGAAGPELAPNPGANQENGPRVQPHPIEYQEALPT